MPQHTPVRTRICPDCDGFPLVAITTGQRTPDGRRETLTAACRFCNGTGHTAPAGVRVRVAR
ncbi:hypothetical protein ACWC0A_23955 [Streptomyces scopuliridis]